MGESSSAYVPVPDAKEVKAPINPNPKPKPELDNMITSHCLMIFALCMELLVGCIFHSREGFPIIAMAVWYVTLESLFLFGLSQLINYVAGCQMFDRRKPFMHCIAAAIDVTMVILLYVFEANLAMGPLSLGFITVVRTLLSFEITLAIAAAIATTNSLSDYVSVDVQMKNA